MEITLAIPVHISQGAGGNFQYKTYLFKVLSYLRKVHSFVTPALRSFVRLFVRSSVHRKQILDGGINTGSGRWCGGGGEDR